jgi:hypothetical protein
MKAVGAEMDRKDIDLVDPEIFQAPLDDSEFDPAEIEAEIQATRHDVTSDLYRLAIHSIGALDSVVPVTDEMSEATIEARRKRYWLPGSTGEIMPSFA